MIWIWRKSVFRSSLQPESSSWWELSTKFSSGLVDSFAVAVPSTETSVCARIGRTEGSPVRWLNALTRPAVTYATPCPVVEYIAPVPAVFAATVPGNEFSELVGEGLRWCTVGIRCHSCVLG